jgi:Tfp pilus assembly protein PilF
VTLDPKDAASWTNLGTLYGGRGQLAEAEQAFRRALAVAPKETQGYIHDNLGTILKAQHRDPEAAAEFESAIVVAPELAQPRISLAELSIRSGEMERARALLEQASKLLLTPDDARWLERVRQQLR